jgi:hypothetical protein
MLFLRDYWSCSHYRRSTVELFQRSSTKRQDEEDDNNDDVDLKHHSQTNNTMTSTIRQTKGLEKGFRVDSNFYSKCPADHKKILLL